jgi:acetylornithine deacetylase/succinyl-diaminopimelate desuccinylase-like protein
LAAVREVTGREAVLWPHMPATGPMYPLTSQFGIPVVGFGTGYYGSAVHAPDENVRLDDYFEGVRVAASFFRAFAQAATD